MLTLPSLSSSLKQPRYDDPTLRAPEDPSNRRVYDLVMNGHAWMGLQTLYGLADSHLRDDEIDSLAERMRQITVQGVKSQALQPQVDRAEQELRRQTTYTNALREDPNARMYATADVAPNVAAQTKKNAKRARYLEQIKASTVKADDGFKHFFDDPVLQKNPSAGLALARYMQGVLGPVPIGESDLKHIQKQLQVQGYGRDLDVTGVWSPQWKGARNEWTQQLYASQLHGDKPGSISFGGAMRALEALTPTSAWNAMIGYVKALPDGARQLMGDLAGGVAAASYMIGHDPRVPFFESETKGETAAGGRAAADVINFLGGDTTAKEAEIDPHDHTQFALHLINDVENLWMLSSLAGGLGRLRAAAGIEMSATSDPVVGAALSTESAFRGPGVIARSLSMDPLVSQGASPLFARTALGGVLGAGGTAVAGGTPTQIAIGGVAGGALGAFSTTKAFQNMPILARTGPYIKPLGSGEGVYYSVRQFVHQPYTWVYTAGGEVSPVKGLIGSAARLGDTAFQGSLLTGAKVRGLAQVNDWIGGEGSTALSREVENTHTLDAVNDAIAKRIHFNVAGQEIAPSVDDLMFVFAGSGARALGETPSSVLSSEFKNASEAMSNALAEPGWAAAISRATGKRFGKLVDEAGGAENFSHFWSWKIAEHAIAWESERRYAALEHELGGPAMGNLSDATRPQILQEIQHEIYQDPLQIKEAIKGMRVQSGIEEFVVRLKKDIGYGSMSVRGTHGDIKTLRAAQVLARDEILPHVGTNVSVEMGFGVRDRPARFVPGELPETVSQLPGQMSLTAASTKVEQSTLYVAANQQAKRFERGLRDAEAELTRLEDVATDPALTAAERRSAKLSLRTAKADYDATLHNWSDAVDEAAGAKKLRDSPRVKWNQYKQEVEAAPVPEEILPGTDPNQLQLGLTTTEERAATNASTTPGAVGIARKDYHSTQMANQKVNEIEARLDELEARANPKFEQGMSGEAWEAAKANRPSAEEWHALESEVSKFLWEEWAIHAPEMPQHGREMIPVMRDQTRLLAADFHVHPEAPKAVHDAVQRLDDMGYKLVLGTDIGHAIPVAAPVDAMEGQLTWRRKAAERAGLNPDAVSNAHVGSHRVTDIQVEMQREVEKGVRLPAFSDPTDIIRYMRHEGVIEGGNISSGMQARRIKKDLDISLNEARALIETGPAQLRDINRKKFVDALSGKTSGRKWAEFASGSTAEFNRQNPLAREEAYLKASDVGDPLRGFEHAPMSREHAERLYRAVVRGSARQPTYLMGASRIEDLFRAYMGFGGLGMENKFGWAMANLPNKLVQIRNQIRFDLSPSFSLRRIVKTNVKVAAEGITPVMDPVKAMKRTGTFEEDLAHFKRLRPSKVTELEYADAADRVIKNQDLFGLFNAGMHEARAVGIWARQGLTDEQIEAKIIRTFEYGSGTTAGRSALERSTNFVFFPFSFEKTLVRNLGYYILDKPAQRLVMTRALAAYDAFNKAHEDGSNPLATSFWQKHAPILEEIERLNAFSHGISLGEPGGINRAMLNMFLPQSWTSNADMVDKLKRMAPVWTDLERVMEEIQDQTNILYGAGENLVHKAKAAFGDDPGTTYVSGGKSKSPGPLAPTISHEAQIQAGFDMYLDWTKDNEDIIAHNAHTTNQDNKIRFPMDPEWGRLAGEPITNAHIHDIVAEKYPAFNSEEAVAIATRRSKEWETFVLDSTGKFDDGTNKRASYEKFGAQADALGRGLVTPGAKPASLARYTAKLRTRALYMAQEDADFYKLYRSNFEKYLGPLEAVTE